MFRSTRPRSSHRVEMPALLPPKVSEFGHQPFTSSEQQSLAHWLREPIWPRGTLDIYALEGYLTALLVWPVALQPGAWLPSIWNENGWKVRPPIDTPERYGEFLELVLGFLRRIDRDLLQAPPVFEPSLHLSWGYEDLDMRERAQSWALGFGRGFSQGVQTRVAPTLDARQAVRTIATHGTGHPHLSKGAHRAEIDFARAVLALAKTRVSRGPLGALPKQTATTESAPQIQPHKEPGPLKDGSRS